MNTSSSTMYDDLTPEQCAQALALFEARIYPDFDSAIESVIGSDHEYDNGYYCGYITDDEPERVSLDDIGIAPGFYD